MSSEDNERMRSIISSAVNRLQDLDWHDTLGSRRACLDVISNLRTVNIPDPDIETLVGHYTGLKPSRVKEYMKVEESDSDKFAGLVARYGLPVRKRIVPPELPPDKKRDAKGVKQQDVK
jgi:hypothetical protein